MTRLAVDAPVALRLVRVEATLGLDHQVVGPGSLRSEVLALRLPGGAHPAALSRTVKPGARSLRETLPPEGICNCRCGSAFQCHSESRCAAAWWSRCPLAMAITRS